MSEREGDTEGKSWRAPAGERSEAEMWAAGSHDPYEHGPSRRSSAHDDERAAEALADEARARIREHGGDSDEHGDGGHEAGHGGHGGEHGHHGDPEAMARVERRRHMSRRMADIDRELERHRVEPPRDGAAGVSIFLADPHNLEKSQVRAGDYDEMCRLYGVDSSQNPILVQEFLIDRPRELWDHERNLWRSGVSLVTEPFRRGMEHTVRLRDNSQKHAVVWNVMATKDPQVAFVVRRKYTGERDDDGKDIPGPLMSAEAVYVPDGVIQVKKKPFRGVPKGGMLDRVEADKGENGKDWKMNPKLLKWVNQLDRRTSMFVPPSEPWTAEEALAEGDAIMNPSTPNTNQHWREVQPPEVRLRGMSGDETGGVMPAPTDPVLDDAWRKPDDAWDVRPKGRSVRKVRRPSASGSERGGSDVIDPATSPASESRAVPESSAGGEAPRRRVLPEVPPPPVPPVVRPEGRELRDGGSSRSSEAAGDSGESDPGRSEHVRRAAARPDMPPRRPRHLPRPPMPPVSAEGPIPPHERAEGGGAEASSSPVYRSLLGGKREDDGLGGGSVPESVSVGSDIDDTAPPDTEASYMGPPPMPSRKRGTFARVRDWAQNKAGDARRAVSDRVGERRRRSSGKWGSEEQPGGAEMGNFDERLDEIMAQTSRNREERIERLRGFLAEVEADGEASNETSSRIGFLERRISEQENLLEEVRQTRAKYGELRTADDFMAAYHRIFETYPEDRRERANEFSLLALAASDRDVQLETEGGLRDANLFFGELSDREFEAFSKEMAERQINEFEANYGPLRTLEDAQTIVENHQGDSLGLLLHELQGALWAANRVRPAESEEERQAQQAIRTYLDEEIRRSNEEMRRGGDER